MPLTSDTGSGKVEFVIALSQYMRLIAANFAFI